MIYQYKYVFDNQSRLAVRNGRKNPEQETSLGNRGSK